MFGAGVGGGEITGCSHFRSKTFEGFNFNEVQFTLLALCVCVRVHVREHVFTVTSKAYFRGKYFILENDRIQISSEEWSLRMLLVLLKRVRPQE